MKKLIVPNMRLFAALAFCLLVATACSTEEEPLIAEKKQEIVSEGIADASRPYTYVEQMPEYNGGQKALMAFLGNNIKYPDTAKKAGVEGVTVISFIVETDGSVSEIKTVKTLSPETDEEARRVVKLTSGQWEPGMQNGKAVRVKYTLPVRYAIK